eukprot:CAMPEP_0178389528 /NCGR_PEP_ID=MMETSP0689_2-20121128/10167_1 /TAXON_ID=160604 /ORGANISM="Amphidinium massartii, Strain CS-259" /LENGTH=86 /DNA_ID=CAMNT_0020009989 /DNA_START=197 /DNA_END=457 /DNA_ORIENTATION=+
MLVEVKDSAQVTAARTVVPSGEDRDHLLLLAAVYAILNEAVGTHQVLKAVALQEPSGDVRSKTIPTAMTERHVPARSVIWHCPQDV